MFENARAYIWSAIKYMMNATKEQATHKYINLDIKNNFTVQHLLDEQVVNNIVKGYPTASF